MTAASAGVSLGLVDFVLLHLREWLRERAAFETLN